MPTEYIDPYFAARVGILYACINKIAPQAALAEGTVRDRNMSTPHIPNDHNFEKLWNIEPSPLWSGPAMMEWIITRILLYGNAYVYINRARYSNKILELIPIDNYGVNVQTENGRNKYTIGSGQDHPAMIVDQNNILHFHGMLRDGNVGLSLLYTGLSQNLSLQIRETNFIYNFFKNGAQQQVAMEIPMTEHSLTPEQRQVLQDQWRNQYAVGIEGQNELLIAQGATYKPISWNLQQNQMIEGREYEDKRIAAVMSVPNSMLGYEGSAGYSGQGISAFYTGFYKMAVQPLLNHIEKEIQRKIFNDRNSTEIFRFNEMAMLRGSPKERYENYKLLLGNNSSPGVFSVNRVLIEMGYPPEPEEIYNKPYHPAMYKQEGRPPMDDQEEPEEIEQ